jgi:hypothetical protein
MDFQPDHYTVDECLSILQVSTPWPDVTPNELAAAVTPWLVQFGPQGENRPAWLHFFQGLYLRVLDALPSTQASTQPSTQALAQASAQALTVPGLDPVATSVETPATETLPDPVPSHTFSVPVTSDVLNPLLKNITQRFINLDSQFRQASGGVESGPTDFTMDLSDPLLRTLSLRLYSIQLPYTWYALDPWLGNTSWTVTNDLRSYSLTLPPGNYAPSGLVDALQTCVEGAGFLPPPAAGPLVTFDSPSGTLTWHWAGWSDPSGQLVGPDARLVFFDPLAGPPAGSQSPLTFSGTLGWMLGFRTAFVSVGSTGDIAAPAVLNVSGTKYVLVVLEDFNQNHVNQGLVSIAEANRSLAWPSYYTPGLPTRVSGLTSWTTRSDTAWFDESQDDQGVRPLGTPKVQFVPSAPRQLTQAQLYTLSAIQEQRQRTLSYRPTAPTTLDTFALVPIKYGSLQTGQLYTELSGQFQDHKRLYFGPVTIDRLRIKLLDDRGRLLQLHGGDWSCTLVSEHLYQL